jgi:hypothetical protein
VGGLLCSRLMREFRVLLAAGSATDGERAAGACAGDAALRYRYSRLLLTGRIRCQYLLSDAMADRCYARWARVAGTVGEEEPDEDNPGDAARLCAGIVPAAGRVTVTGGRPDHGLGHAALVPGVALLRPEEQVMEAMLAGWAGQQGARGLSGETISGRQGRIRSFTEHAGCPPWLWTPQLFEEWCADLRSVHHVAASTLRGQAGAVRLFCEYLTDPAYAWAEVCWGYFGTHPVQVCTRWNTPRLSALT